MSRSSSTGSAKEGVNTMARGSVAGVLIAVAMMLCAAPITLAQQGSSGAGRGNLRIGQIEVHGELSQRITYDDNIFIEPDTETDDVIFVTTPTVNFVLPGERINANVFYSAALRAFADNEQENSQNQTLNAAFAYRTPRGNFFRLENRYLDTTDLSTSEEQSNIAPRTRWHNNRVSATVGLPEIPSMERIDLEFGYNFDKRYFDRDENSTEDRDTNEIVVRWYYDVSPFLPKTRFLVEYLFGVVEFDDGAAVGRDSNYHIVRTGVNIEPTAKLSGNATLGAEFRDWDFKANDMTLFNVRTNLRYRYAAATTAGEAGAVNLTIVREIRESAFRFLNRVKPVVEVTRFDIGVQHRFNLPAGNATLPLTFFANFFYELDDYPGIVTEPITGLPDEREDDFLGAGVRLRLDGWLPNMNLNYFASLGYEVNDRDSNFNLKDYTANRVSLLLGVNF